MLSPVLRVVTGITFYWLPNDVVIGFVFLFAMFFATLAARVLYILMHRRHQYPNDQVHLAVLGAKTLRTLSILMLIALCLLGFRVSPGIEHGQFWALDSVSRGWWCIIRMAIGGLAALCASVFETHPAFRAWSSLTIPLCAVLDLLSESNFAVQISCIDHGLCLPDDRKLNALYAYAWRDVISAVLTLTYTGLSTWLWFLYGVASNDLVMPRKEHRVMSARLDKIRLKPKEQTRRQTEEENQLEKMLGYN